MKDEYDKYISSKVYKECNGMRLNNTSLSIKINENIEEFQIYQLVRF